MRKLFAELCKDELRKNINSYVLLGDIGVGSFLTSDDVLVDRAINMGIAEQAMISFGAGLSAALGGNVVIHTISPFLTERALEQIKLSCGYNQFKLILISANGPYDYEKLGPTHHCISDVAILSTIPNLNIRLPSTREDFRECFDEAILSEKSTYIRLTSRSVELDVNPEIIGEFKKISLKNGAPLQINSGLSKSGYICIGESLKYLIQLSKQNPNDEYQVYWSSNPLAEIPSELNSYERIEILEPYAFEKISSKNLNNVKLIRKTFRVKMNKRIMENMGWEDFQ